MKVITKRLRHNTTGAGDLLNITEEIREMLDDCGLEEGTVNVFVVGSTAAITSFEYESGMVADMRDLYERIASRDKHYSHDDTWNDANGFSHVRAALQGPSLLIPFQDAKLLLGTWQQVVLAEFDNQPRKREVVLTFTGV
ncbi:MAG: YjbQ family protein [PVC group bacterium]|nr:YjbQ family protein [PVC group bacterium]